MKWVEFFAYVGIFVVVGLVLALVTFEGREQEKEKLAAQKKLAGEKKPRDGKAFPSDDCICLKENSLDPELVKKKKETYSTSCQALPKKSDRPRARLRPVFKHERRTIYRSRPDLAVNEAFTSAGMHTQRSSS